MPSGGTTPIIHVPAPGSPAAAPSPTSTAASPIIDVPASPPGPPPALPPEPSIGVPASGSPAEVPSPASAAASPIIDVPASGLPADAPPAPPPALPPAALPEAPVGRVPTWWGCFRITYRAARGGCHGGLQARCPFHALNAKTGCKRQFTIFGPLDSDTKHAMQRLCWWCSLARTFHRQRGMLVYLREQSWVQHKRGRFTTSANYDFPFPPVFVPG